MRRSFHLIKISEVRVDVITCLDCTLSMWWHHTLHRLQRILVYHCPRLGVRNTTELELVFLVLVRLLR